MADALGPGIFQQFINYLFQSGDISVPADYHEQCTKIHEMLGNDVSGTVDTILDYAVNSASEANYRIECSEDTLQKLLNLWLEDINIEIKGIPTGLQALSKEYFKERWEGSSFCILRVKDWKKITRGGVTDEEEYEILTRATGLKSGELEDLLQPDYRLLIEKFVILGTQPLENPT
jgi:hypothetical protein